MLRIRKDWVYTTEGYSSGSVSLQNDPTGAVAVPLTISQNARYIISHGTPGTEPIWTDLTQYQSSAAVPETGHQVIYAVDGYVIVTVQDWALATFFRLGMRLLHEEQDPSSGDLVTTGTYSMWEGITPEDVNMIANRGYLKEWYKAERWEGGLSGLVTRTSFVYPIRWRSRRGIRLMPNRALFLYMETSQNSRGLDVWTRLRTRMAAGVSD